MFVSNNNLFVTEVTFLMQEWLCKSFMFLHLYAIPASIMWTFVEGLYLSQRLTLAVFKKEAPFKLYYFIGWG
jgi:7 transmembrane receptor (Secretin family)